MHAPGTLEQRQEWSQHWPINWRPPDVNRQPHLAELAPAEVAAMQQHMGTAWQLAERAGGSGGVANACLIVDPQRNAVIAQTADCSHRHPLQHAAMAAVAAASEWQMRVWPPEQPSAGSSGAQQGAAAAAAAAEPVAAAVEGQDRQGRQAEAEGKRRRLEGSSDVRDAAAANTAGTAAAEPAAEPATQPAGAAPAGDPGPRPYLCTGYDCYLLHEPCTMCAMALVHSRLRRVIFCAPDAAAGALGGAFKLHAQRSLNHHYLVYRLPLAEA